MTETPHFAAVILSAGLSSRMGSLKPLLPLGSSTVLERVIDTFWTAGIRDIYVVTGHRSEALGSLLRQRGINEVHNSDYQMGMFSSVAAGLRAVPQSADACFLMPGDVPLVRPDTITALAQAYQDTHAKIVHPVAEGRRGHPLLLARPIVEEISRAAIDSNLRTIVEAHSAEAVELEVFDDAIHLDMDTPADYEAVRRRTAQGAVLSETASVCPRCLERLPARRVAYSDGVYLEKTCPQHGEFRTVIWRGAPHYSSWGPSGDTNRSHKLQPDSLGTGAPDQCPYECGLCPSHLQSTCCVVLEVTQRCNLECPFCFAAASRAGTDPDLETLRRRCEQLRAASGTHLNIQLSGGEPTVRPDLPEVISMVRNAGFDFVQLNTNGIRLATDKGYAAELKEAGLGCVFLQFDGLTDEIYQQMRGRPLLRTKLLAIRACREQQLGVVLVPTLVPDVNTEQIGAILEFAIGQRPAVRAVHFQPVSYFGRFPREPEDRDRITLPEVLQKIERQTHGRIAAAHFSPPSAENAYCSFQGKFIVDQDGSIRPSVQQTQNSCCGSSAAGLVQLGAGTAKRSRDFVARQWAFPPPVADSDELDLRSFDALLQQQRNTFSISGMAFQDAWNFDLERVRECFLHAAAPDGKLIPLCAYNLTSSTGRSLYRSGGLQQ